MEWLSETGYNPGMDWKRILPALLAVALLLAGCGPAGEQPTGAAPAVNPPGADVRFTPYASATPSPSSTPTPPGTATPLPSPSPTPRQHTVERGQDMGGIAFLYGLSLEELMAANPNVNPNSMSIGTVLLIPGSAARPASADSTAAPSLTPVPLQAGAVTCAATREGGAWCFLPVTNTTGTALENLSAVIRLADDASGAIVSQTALPPLDRLAPGATMPLTAYFPAPVPEAFHAGGELLTAMPVAGGGRYREAVLVDTQITIDPGGLSANARGAVRLEDGQDDAQHVWVVAVAYDADGTLVGVRRWEAEQPLPAGDALAFDFAVYSTGAPIQSVELLVQARP